MDSAQALETSRFVRSLPEPEDFAAAISGDGDIRLPDEWIVAVTDVVRSRDAISKGRYKAVNMAGVALISGVMNALGSRDVPFVFGGDGAAVAIAPDAADTVRDVLAGLATFASEELDLELRAALVPVSAIRDDGFEVRVKLVRMSEALSNYAFTGGGISHAETLMKQGRFRVEKAPAGTRPDLSGLSCRWMPVQADHGKIVSIIVEPASQTSPRQFAQAVRFLLETEVNGGDPANPVPREGPEVAWPVTGMDLEARAARRQGSYWKARLKIYLETAFAWFLFKTGMSVGGFDPDHYRRYTSLNTDFRKIQDGLRLTLSLSAEQLISIEKRLEQIRRKGLVRFGLCSQDSAVLTCYVPSVTRDDHIHFLDGAGGGYAQAASNMR